MKINKMRNNKRPINKINNKIMNKQKINNKILQMNKKKPNKQKLILMIYYKTLINYKQKIMNKL